MCTNPGSLDIFREGWNHHGIRSAGHLSPHQLFVQRALQLHSSGLTALDLFEEVDDTYGIDEVERIDTGDSRDKTVYQ